MTDDAERFVGDPDGFGRLWTPHRMVYIKGENKPAHDEAGDGCPFCTAPSRTDEDALIVARGETVYAVLNLYPYNSGHLMSVPYRHVADYPDLDEAETLELAQFTQRAMRVIGAVMSPHGFNLGINQGTAAGAGITAHLHEHVVPRWGGDTNFMPVIGNARVLPQSLADSWRELRGAF
jgi:ATP adenylyltransferase